MIVRCIFLLLVLWTTYTTSLVCYECSCDPPDFATCVCETIDAPEDTYCVILVERYIELSYYELSYVDRNSTWIYIEDSYYILVQESIYYNETSYTWTNWARGVVFGCDWDLCNAPELIQSLPDTFKLTINETWLNENIYGTGNVTSCHTCTDPLCSNTSTSIDYDLCPYEPCINASLCILSDLWNNIDTGEMCYQSQCAPEEFYDDFESVYGGKYSIAIEAIVYLAQDRSKYDIWELDIYCGAENCSRPTIFDEAKAQISAEISDLTAFPLTRPPTTLPPPTTTSTPPTNPLRCYNCECESDTCPCNTYETSSADDTYCTIVRSNYGEDVYIDYEHIDRNSTRVYIREFPYIVVEESIIYNEITNVWFTRTNLVVYGCKTDLCNKPSLLLSLPASFRMHLDDSWLNANVRGSGAPVRDCHQCPDGPSCGTTGFLDPNECPIQACNTTCLVADTYDDPTSNQECYESFCAPPDSEDFVIDRYRVELEGIIYGSRPNAPVELWEIDIYCRADNCSRPEIFQELRQNLTTEVGDLSGIFSPAIIPGKRLCYECYCYNQIEDCECDTITAEDADSTYCVTIRENYEDDFWFYFEHIDRNSTRVYVREFPYILAEESIIYNDTTQIWKTVTNLVVYGCNFDLCNHPSLMPIIPGGFQMRLPDQWLNDNILETGAPDRTCHECPDIPTCGNLDFIDAGRCPPKACNNTCIVSDLYDDPDSDNQCYQSFCGPPDDPDFEIDPHRIEIEVIIYGNRPDEVEVWEVDIYCRADDCTRPEIFTELQEKLTIEKGNLSAIFNFTIIPGGPQRLCYDCFCYDQPDCECKTITARSAISTYCTIIREEFGDGDYVIDLEHIDRNSTRVYIREFPYLLAEESISYNETSRQWNTFTNFIVHGCNFDLCNYPDLVQYLPTSFQMSLTDDWLNTNVLGTGVPARNCHECPNVPSCGPLDFIDPNQCPVQPCNTTCLVSELYDDPASNNQCYQSFCAPPNTEDFEIDPHRVEIEGILYRSKPDEVEIWEVDIYCRADDCSRPQIFAEIRDELDVETKNLLLFFNISTIFTSPTRTTTTTRQPSTSANPTGPGVSTTTASPGSGTTTTGSGGTTSAVPTGPGGTTSTAPTGPGATTSTAPTGPGATTSTAPTGPGGTTSATPTGPTTPSAGTAGPSILVGLHIVGLLLLTITIIDFY